MRLAGKTALVTGAGRGIGAAIAEAFAAEGALVWVSDLDPGAADTVAGRIGRNARSLALDVRKPDDRRAAERAIRARDGELALLVNNAGITGLEDGAAQDVETVALEDWRAVLATNLEGVVRGCQMAIRAMRAGGGGSIVNVASRSGHAGTPAAAAYAASKAAVLNHTRSVALHCAERDLAICCNAISPAAILTPMWEPMPGDAPDREARMARFVADAPLRRFGEPAEVAALAVLLASDEARYMTGADVALDGGLLAGTAARPEGGPMTGAPAPAAARPAPMPTVPSPRRSGCRWGPVPPPRPRARRTSPSRTRAGPPGPGAGRAGRPTSAGRER